MNCVQILNLRTDLTVGRRIYCAESFRTRLVGLLGREVLEAGQGLWLKPCSGVHTFGMAFPIDVVGLDRWMRVIRLWPDLSPNRITPIQFGVRSVLELQAGEIGRRHIELGDQLQALPQ